MKEHLDPQVEAVEPPLILTQSPTPTLLESIHPVISDSEIGDDIDWEIEIIAQRYSDMDKDTKTDGSQGCH